MTPQTAFLHAMLEEPDNLDLRLICADWLQDQADPVLAARGEFLRLQSQLLAWVPDLEQRGGMQARGRKLLEENREAWLGRLPEFCSSWEFEGGLVRLTMDLDSFLDPGFSEQALGLFKAGWVQTVRLEGASRRLAGAAHLSQVSCLDLSGNRLDDEAVRTLVVSPHLQRLRRLDLANNQLTDASIELLAGAGLLEQLTGLDLRNNGLSEKGIEILLGSPLGQRLQWLALAGNDLRGRALDLWRDYRHQHQQRDPATGLPKRLVNSVGMELVLIPAGTYLMGSPPTEKEREKDEGPVHEVVITRPFYLGTCLVTQEQYARVAGTNPSHFSRIGGGANLVEGLDTRCFPVEYVAVEEAREFCRQLSRLPGERLPAGTAYRLPTEAEWEFACRAGGPAGLPFSCGQSLCYRQANFEGEVPYGTNVSGPPLRRPTVVGSYAANAFGLFDMHGNCWDWCNDWYEADYYAHSPREDPPGPATGAHGVLRGGSWFNAARYCRSAERIRTTETGSFCIGFRVVLPVG